MKSTFTSCKRTTFLASLIFLFHLGMPFQSQAQTEPEYLQQWTPLEEAEFHFDVAYAIVRCSPESDAIILLNAFNEGGNVESIGFTLEMTDKNGNKATVEVQKFNIGFAEMQIASCEGDDFAHLKLLVPEGVDPASLSIEITYNK